MAGEKVLVVDDDYSLRKGYVEYLKMMGYEAEEAEDGEVALEKIKSTPYRIVLADLQMPRIDGLELLRRHKKYHLFDAPIDVIIITAYGDIEKAVKALKLGAYDFLTKPVQYEELDMLFRRCLEKQNLESRIEELKEIVNLYEMSKAIGSLMELDSLLELILQFACDTLQAEKGTVMLYDHHTGELEVRTLRGEISGLSPGVRIGMGEGIAGAVAKGKEPILIDRNMKTSPRFRNIEELREVHTAIGMPLVTKGELVGVLTLYRMEDERANISSGMRTVDIQSARARKAFLQRELNLLTIFAAQAATAIENASLFKNLEEEKEKIAKIFTLMSDGSAVIDSESNILMLNRTAEGFFNLNIKECMGKNFFNRPGGGSWSGSGRS